MSDPRVGRVATIANRDEAIDVSIVIINWKTADKLKKCIASIVDTSTGVRFEAFIIDNSPDGRDFDALMREYSGNGDLTFLKSDTNEGGVAANRIASAMKGRYLLILGPDVIILDSALQKMVDFMDSVSQAGAASARLLNPDGSPQMYYYKLWDMSMVFYVDTIIGRVIDRIFFLDGKRRFYRGLNLDVDSVIELDQPPGVCWIVRPELLLRDGFIVDPLFPFYYDDVDCCKRVWNSGYRIYLLASADVIHDQGASYRQAGVLWKRRESIKGQMRYFRKYFPNDIKWLKLMRVLDFLPQILEHVARKRVNDTVSVRDRVRNELVILKDCMVF
jgi:GT2 family glycosyltransferase